MNMVWIAGHLGADPEVRFTPSGQKIVNLRVAANSRRQGKDETIWWRVTIFGDRFDKMLTYLKKGSAVIIMGRMNPPQMWTDREGRQQVSLELIAETIDFSPFGKGERSSGSPEQAAMGYGDNRSSQGSPMAARESGYPSAPSPYEMPAQQFSNAAASYGNMASPQYGAGADPSHGFSEQEDEEPPF